MIWLVTEILDSLNYSMICGVGILPAQLELVR